MRKLACVFSFQESSWMSCQKIVFNIHKAYEGLRNVEIKNFHYGPDSLSGDLPKLANSIQDYGPTDIIIMDHKPHPFYLLKVLLPMYEGSTKPRVIFHVFGDFTLYYKEWSKLGPILRGFQTEFLVASHRQKILIDKFLEPHQESKIFPFPVRSEEFFFDENERLLQRKAWDVGDDETVFTFTGRISRQKRTIQLLKLFHEAIEKSPHAKSRLYIYGLPDHVGDHFMNVWENENEYFRRVHRTYTQLPESTRSRIHFMGNLPNSELRAVYAGTDYLVNLSVHNDEDFGMSVAEAQACGLPAILTDWGGLASFEHTEIPEATIFIPVRIGKNDKILSKEAVITAMCQVMENKNLVDRKHLMSISAKRFCIETQTIKAQEVIEDEQKPFVALSELHALISKRISYNLPVYMDRKGIRPTFRKLYSAYVRNT